METKKDTAAPAVPTEFGYAIMRDHILPSVLGKHEGEILYWAGKELSRTFPLFDMEEAPDFFNEAGWGGLMIETKSRREFVYRFTPDPEQVKKGARFYSMEAGFLAGQYGKIHECMSECHAEPDRKSGTVLLRLVWEK